MLCFLTSLEGPMLGLLIVVGIIAMRQWSRIDKLKAQAKGIRPEDRHPQDRIRSKRRPPVAHPAPATVPAKESNPLDWLAPEKEAVVLPDVPIDALPTTEPAKQPTSWLARNMPHIKAFGFALSAVVIWFGFACWYDHLNRYMPPEGDDIGDFRILYLKKVIGALLPLISGVDAALALLFMLNPRYYIYLNGWLLTDYDFYTDLRHLDKPECFRRVLVFTALFGLFLLVSLWVLLHSSPQEMTL